MLAPDGVDRFSLSLANSGTVSATRILKAAVAPGAGLAVAPSSGRTDIAGAESAQQALAVEPAPVFGEGAYRVTLAGSGAANLSLRLPGAAGQPVLFAWDEAALVRSEWWTAILAGAINALLAASFAFALGAAILSGSVFARAAAVFLVALLMAQLAATGIFDTLFLAWSGLLALQSLALAAVLAAGLYLLDRIAPLKAAVPASGPFLTYAAAGILAAGLLAYVNVPAMGLLIRGLLLIAALGAPVYLHLCGRAGNTGARRLAPAAAIFALVAVASAVHALGFLGAGPVMPRAIGGFAAAGALLLAVAAAVQADPFAASLPRQDLGRITAGNGKEHGQGQEISALAAALQGVFDFDLRSKMLVLSEEAASMLGLSSSMGQIDADTWLSLIHADDRKIFRGALDTYRRNRDVPFRIEFRAQARGGKTAWFELRATVTGASPREARCLGLIAEITTWKKSSPGEAASSLADPLTGLGSRSDLLVLLGEMRGETNAAALAVFDVDRFKSVNASLGREGGDALLAAFAVRLAGAFPPRDPAGGTVFRIGGDMFAAAARDVSDLKGFGDRLLDLLGAPFRISGRDIYLPASVGISWGKDAWDAEELFDQAERAMVEAKREGGGRAVVYSKALAERAPRDEVAIDSDLRRALERGEIEIHYQPVVRLKDGAVAGFEALMRWRRPEQGIVEPAEFVPQAERSGQIVGLGRFALRQAAKDLARWQKSSTRVPPIFVSVNASWPQIRDKSFLKDLSELLRVSGIAAGSLKLEMTEGKLILTPQTEAALARLKSAGAGLAIDDFGAGHSSLGRLASLPFDTVKLDRSLILGSATQNGAQVLRAMIALARDLGMTVICEGVENETEAALIKQAGCEYGQGYFFGAPAPAPAIDALVAEAGKGRKGR